MEMKRKKGEKLEKGNRNEYLISPTCNGRLRMVEV